MADPAIIVTQQNGIAEVQLNRPDKRNALNMALFDALTDTAQGLQGTPGLRAVILHGAGPAFCAGIDTAELPRMLVDLEIVRQEMRAAAPGRPNRYQRPVMAWSALEVPVIAALQGLAYGAGLQLALGADFRIASPDTTFSIMESRWGLIPDMGITQFLPRLMRADQAKDLILTGRIFDADEALSLGLLTRIAEDPLPAARAMAAELATRSPDVLRAGKKLVDDAWMAPPGVGLQLEGAYQADILGQPNQIEAVTAGMQKRPPRFRDIG